MEHYTDATPKGKSVDGASLRFGQWSLRRRLAWTWAANPNHVAGAHSKRRKGLERRYERAEKMRVHLVAACRHELERDPERSELEAYAAQLVTLGPAVVGALVDPAAIGPGGRKRQAWYLPDVAHELAALVVRLVRRVMKVLQYLGRRRITERVRASVAYLGAALRASRVPHSVPPQTPEEKPKEENSSKPAALKEPLADVIRRLREKYGEQPGGQGGGEAV